MDIPPPVKPVVSVKAMDDMPTFRNLHCSSATRRRWLEAGDPERPPIGLLRPSDANKMTAWKVDKAVGNVKNDLPELIDSTQGQQAFLSTPLPASSSHLCLSRPVVLLYRAFLALHQPSDHLP